jgi:hypothetical protein
MDHALDYNEEPGYMRDLLLYNLTVEALDRLEASPLSKREIIRRLGTSPAQFYRLMPEYVTLAIDDRFLHESSQ